MSDQEQAHFTRQRVRERRESLLLQQESLADQQRRITVELAETDPDNEWRDHEENNSNDQRRPTTSRRTTNRGRGRGRASHRGVGRPPSRGRARSAIAREVATAGRFATL